MGSNGNPATTRAGVVNRDKVRTLGSKTSGWVENELQVSERCGQGKQGSGRRLGQHSTAWAGLPMAWANLPTARANFPKLAKKGGSAWLS
jgi:hypothetical protein